MREEVLSFGVFDFCELIVHIEADLRQYLKERFLVKVDFLELRISLVVDIGISESAS